MSISGRAPPSVLLAKPDPFPLPCPALPYPSPSLYSRHRVNGSLRTRASPTSSDPVSDLEGGHGPQVTRQSGSGSRHRLVEVVVSREGWHQRARRHCNILYLEPNTDFSMAAGLRTYTVCSSRKGPRASDVGLLHKREASFGESLRISSNGMLTTERLKVMMIHFARETCSTILSSFKQWH